MKNLILGTGLIAISLQGRLYAQTDHTSAYSKFMLRSKIEQTFNLDGRFFRIRDFVTLKEGRMILDLYKVSDYESFKNLDSILTVFRKDVAFYKDSLDANLTGGMRIDYVLSDDYSFKKIRFKRHNGDGEIFMNKDGEIARLKFEQDTIRIIIQKSMPGIARHKSQPCDVPYSVQATFILGNYYDIDRVIGDKVLAGIIDTLEKSSQPKKTKKKYYQLPFTIVYNPYYNGKSGLDRIEWLMNNEYDHFGLPHKPRFLSVNATIGVGLVRNTVTPTADIGIQYNKYWYPDMHNLFRLSVSPYCFFDKDAQGNFILNDNWFINADIGSSYDNGQTGYVGGWFGKECTFGVGYLFAGKGGYFKNSTFKLFTDVMQIRGITIVPEFIFTNDFKQIFPGITVKVF